ncbi:MAG: VWA domain-containing protein, partial [Burkholderiaceae bacterium]|nr:VWA domain-containing protein [Burkholderiaceae bacterium]
RPVVHSGACDEVGVIMIASLVLRTIGFILLVAVGGCALGPQAATRVHSLADGDSLPLATPVIDDKLDAGAARDGAGPEMMSILPMSSQAIADGPIVLRVRLSRAEVDQSGPKKALVRVDYAATAKALVERPSLSVALVIDRSGSMAEGRKLQYALAAARWVVDNLAEGDMLSIIAFGDQATVLSAAGRVVNKPFLLHRLDEISPAGSTNLSGGLLEGIAQVSGTVANAQFRQVLLLTDGLANRGETNPANLRRIAESARAQGIGVSTMGVGADFNEAVLTDIAVAGGGRYTYVKTAEQIPSAFKDELYGLLDPVAQNMTVELSLRGGVIGKVYGQLIDQPGRTYRLAVGDLRATESGLLLAALVPSGIGDVNQIEVDARLIFDDPQAAKRVNQAVRVSVQGDVPLGEDQSVTLMADILDALERADAVGRGLDMERFVQAKALFLRLHERAREHAILTRDQQLLNQAFVLKHIMAELTAAEREGLLHGHRGAREKLVKESHYLLYLLTHHQTVQP